MKHIAISIEYAGLTLPVVKNEQGSEIVPLKPVSSLFGLDWTTQYKKIQDPWMTRYLGVCIGSSPYAGGQNRDQVCIRLDRVAAYLMTLSPAMIRAKGNESGADFLEAKLTEWADALHDYETFGSAHNPRHADALLAIRQANAIANVAKMKDAALRRIALARLGIDDAAAAPASPAGDLFAAS
jgi:hypothetical protein